LPVSSLWNDVFDAPMYAADVLRNDKVLFYLDWLMDHRKDLQWLVLEKLGKQAA
jgi:hypothetical protein